MDEQDPAIFNNEGLSYNQIKVKEQLLKDASGCQWLVGYYARKNNKSTTNLKGDSVDYSANITYTVDGEIRRSKDLKIRLSDKKATIIHL